MITKEVANRIAHATGLIISCHSEIENGEKMIAVLKKTLADNERKEGVNVEVFISSQSGTYSIKKLPIQLGIDGITHHVETKKKELEALQLSCKDLINA